MNKTLTRCKGSAVSYLSLFMGVLGLKCFKWFSRFFHRFWKIILLLIFVAVITFISNVLLAVWLNRAYDISVPSVGTISVTGVEALGGDIGYINGTAFIDWGTIQCGESKTITLILRSASNVQTRLAFNTTDWKPESIKNYVTLSWNYNKTLLAPSEEVTIDFTLSTPDNRDFSEYLILNSVYSYNFTLYIYAEK